MSETIESVRIDAASRQKEQRENIDWRGKNFKQSVYANLYEDSAGTDIALTTAGTFYQWVSSTVGESSGIDYLVASAASDDITVGVSGAGVYLVNISISFTGSNNSNIHGVVFLDAARQGAIEFHRKLSGSDIGNASASGLIVLASGNVIDLRFSSDTNTTTLTVSHVHLTLVRISA